jgi:uncharacterized protein (TIRG00374 family)
LYLVVNFVVYYMPTPGASGSVEAMYIMVLAGFIPGAYAVLATMIWRFSTFYLHVFLGAIVYFVFQPKYSAAAKRMKAAAEAATAPLVAE